MQADRVSTVYLEKDFIKRTRLTRGRWRRKWLLVQTLAILRLRWRERLNMNKYDEKNMCRYRAGLRCALQCFTYPPLLQGISHSSLYKPRVYHCICNTNKWSFSRLKQWRTLTLRVCNKYLNSKLQVFRPSLIAHMGVLIIWKWKFYASNTYDTPTLFSLSVDIVPHSGE